MCCSDGSLKRPAHLPLIPVTACRALHTPYATNYVVLVVKQVMIMAAGPLKCQYRESTRHVHHQVEVYSMYSSFALRVIRVPRLSTITAIHRRPLQRSCGSPTCPTLFALPLCPLSSIAPLYFISSALCGVPWAVRV